ncbi:MAG: NAD-dependent epimerase/dehydratase family protein [Coprococcus sp.]
MKKAIVTGANGFIGKTLVKVLLERNYEIVALDIRFDDVLLNNNLVTCVNVLNKAVAELKDEIPKNEYDCFFHLAWAGTSGPARADYEMQLNNVKIACDYIKLCKVVGCKRVVYASSINEMETYEYLQSDNIEPSGGYIYGTGKLAAHLMGETVAKMNDVEFIPVIITNIYGIGEKSARMVYTSINKLIHKEHCSFTAGYQTYDFIYITDAINSIIEVSEKGKAFNRYYIGSGEPKPLREFLIEMKNIVDPEAEIGLGDMSFKGIDISYSQFDLKKVEKDTGYRNKVSFAEGIKMTADYIREEQIIG